MTGKVTRANLVEAARTAGCAVTEADGAVTLVNGNFGVVVRGKTIRRLGLPPLWACNMTAKDAAKLLGFG